MFFWKNSFGKCYTYLLGSFNPWKDLSNEVSYTSNRDNMTKLRPQEVGYTTNPNEAYKLLELHLLGLRFWLFMVFSYYSIIKMPLSLILTQFRGI